ncbi:hypothetical protein RIF29_28530 [Crotalaria pallida]|uniref:Uncharacterized protein n=1 Tax=Crotalaria pallida TaxID=3830 RepID=A0AAN9HV44_CROPI
MVPPLSSPYNLSGDVAILYWMIEKWWWLEIRSQRLSNRDGGASCRVSWKKWYERIILLSIVGQRTMSKTGYEQQLCLDALLTDRLCLIDGARGGACGDDHDEGLELLSLVPKVTSGTGPCGGFLDGARGGDGVSHAVLQQFSTSSRSLSSFRSGVKECRSQGEHGGVVGEEGGVLGCSRWFLEFSPSFPPFLSSKKVSDGKSRDGIHGGDPVVGDGGAIFAGCGDSVVDGGDITPGVV